MVLSQLPHPDLAHLTPIVGWRAPVHPHHSLDQFHFWRLMSSHPHSV